MRLMTEHRVRHLPVLDGEKIIGVVSIGDLVNWIISAAEHNDSPVGKPTSAATPAELRAGRRRARSKRQSSKRPPMQRHRTRGDFWVELQRVQHRRTVNPRRQAEQSDNRMLPPITKAAIPVPRHTQTIIPTKRRSLRPAIAPFFLHAEMPRHTIAFRAS